VKPESRGTTLPSKYRPLERKMQATPNTVIEITLFLDQRTYVPFADLLQCQLKRWDRHSQDDAGPMTGGSLDI
jgi:hypothetical protein